MKKYVCSICGYIYDEAKGIPEAGIAPGTTWDALPDDWVCPLCGAQKSEFSEMGSPADAPEKKVPVMPVIEEANRELTPMEVSIVCSNLARGCEKQYMAEEAEAFSKLAAYFKVGAAPAENPSMAELLKLVEQDLEEGFTAANAVSADEQDRGALRALVWSEKVTRILKSLLARYEKEGDDWLNSTGVYICTICGFIFVGDEPPEICPVCKVPSWKFEKIEGRDF